MLLLSLVSMPHPGVGCGGTAASAGLVVASGVVISEFYPCALARDEYFSISCLDDRYFSLRDWSVTDGEGEIRFISDLWLLPGKTFTVTNNATSFWNAYSRLPDLSLDSPGIGNLVAVTGSFRLADAGDSLVLLSSDGETLDAVTYGSANESLAGWSGASVPSLRKGEIAKRLEVDGRFVDTDTAADWQPFREFRYGYTEFESPRFKIPAGAITAFTSPDCSLDVVASAIDNAWKSVCICTYEFSSGPICERLLGALDRGVKVRLLVDGAPAGDIEEIETSCLSVLRLAGGEVLTVNGNVSEGVVQHVGALHAKYLVIDSSISIVMSENLVEDGLPQDRVFGNRGWGVMFSDVNLAGFLQGLFDSDARLGRLDVSDWRSDSRFNASPALPRAPKISHNQMLLGPFVTTQPASVTVVPSPDGSVRRPYLLDFMHPRKSVAVEQFQADLYWNSRWTGERYLNPLVQALLSSASEGVEDRVLLDSSWFNAARNQQVADCLREHPASGSSLLSALLDERSPVTLLHNKGAVIDGRISAITSNNWVSASFSRNRELAVMVESEEVASHFLKAFDFDWLPDETPPVCDAGADVELDLGRSVVLDAGACYDDRMISEYSWDFDADGIVDSHENLSLFEGTVPGEHIVVLKVTDAWGNSATDEVHVAVVSPMPSDEGDDIFVTPRQLWPIPVLMAAGAIAARMIRGRRTDPDSRNLNHRPRS